MTPPTLTICDANFITSAPTIKDAPDNDYINEVVFIARSNTGKSSLLNTLTNRKSLAKVSQTPGKTQLINYFAIHFLNTSTKQKSEARFVDLPGFGYAKVSKSQHAHWEQNLTQFIGKRKQIRIFVHLKDARHEELSIDTNVTTFLESIKMPHQEIFTVFTKIDKLNQSELNKLKARHKDAYFVSNLKKRGHNKLVEAMYHSLFEEQA